MNHYPPRHFGHYPQFMPSSNPGRISLDLHRYNFEKENHHPHQKRSNYCDSISNSSDDFDFDEMLTTTSEEMKSDYFLMDKKRKINYRQPSPENIFKSRIGPLTKFHSLSTIHTPNDSSDDELAFRKRKPPRALEMIKEISPILPVSSDRETELPPMMPLKMTKEFQPLQTSTTTSFYPHMMPKTNPRLTAPSTPRNLKFNLDDFRPGFVEKRRMAKPEHFGLPSQVARRYGSNGILYLKIAVSRRLTLRVQVRNAIFFLDPSQPINSFVAVEIKRKPTSSRKRLKPSRQRVYHEVSTRTVLNDNSPKYSEDLRLKLARESIEENNILSISVYSEIQHGNMNEKELIGCMAFPLKKMFEKIDGLCERRGRSRSSSADADTFTVAAGGYFLLGKERGSVSHLSESKISHRKYYDEIGGSSCSSSAVSSSPIKVSKICVLMTKK
uniref:C2 domain-containing protein n=1 Tax=Panagrolaimus sp. JU765 TaxID=591449 RepID=A0AC34QZK9_9BILA